MILIEEFHLESVFIYQQEIEELYKATYSQIKTSNVKHD